MWIADTHRFNPLLVRDVFDSCDVLCARGSLDLDVTGAEAGGGGGRWPLSSSLGESEPRQAFGSRSVSRFGGKGREFLATPRPLRDAGRAR